MVKHLNRCTFLGVLAEDADPVSQSAHSPVTFVLKCTHKFRIGSRWSSQTEHIRCFWWGHEAKAKSHKLTKGLCVFVEGRLETQPNYSGIRVESATLVGSQYDLEEQGAEADD